MAALELSIDKDWLRYPCIGVLCLRETRIRGDGKTAHGFDSILDNPNFAGGFFSFWNRERNPAHGTGVGLTQGDGLLPDLRSSKIEGQANFVNPGIFIYNAGMDVEITPKLRGVFNLNLIRFDHTEPLELLLFQTRIHAGVGADSGIGLKYRPRSPTISDQRRVQCVRAISGVHATYILVKHCLALAANVRFRF